MVSEELLEACQDRMQCQLVNQAFEAFASHSKFESKRIQKLLPKTNIP